MSHRVRIVSFFSLLLFLAMAGITPNFGGEAAFEQPIQSVPGTKPAAVDQVMSVGLWRIDGTFQSTIRVYNRHIIQHRAVMPVLYMTDGTEYDLPIQDVAPNGMVTINVNNAVANAPAQVRSHVSLYGSASIHFLAPSTDSVAAGMLIVDAVNSLSFLYSFDPPDDRTEASQHTFDGMWWRRDSGITGFVGLSNNTAHPIGISLQVVGAAGTSTPPQMVTLGGNNTRLLSLDEIVENLPANQKLMGGLRITFTGKDSDVMITGGLVNQTEGYSALIPFYLHDPAVARGGPMTLASTGIMVGQADPRMGFPDGTAFFPYAYLRNASSSPMKVDRAIYYTLAGGGGQRISLPGLTLAPGYAVQVPLDLGSVGLGGYSGEITETFSATVNPGDLIVATGSTDQTANYVFEVLPQAVATTQSKQDCFWMVGGGWDTMSTLWNSGSAPEDLIVTIGFKGGDGHYKLPVHLEPGAGKVIDLAEIIRAAKPDADGHLIPRNVQGGGMIISGSSGLPEKINVVVSGGVFSVFGATCVPPCVTCGPPPTELLLTPASLSVAVGGSQQMTSTIEFSNGQSFDNTSNTTWTSKNTSVATVSSGGMMNAMAVGSTDIDGQDDFLRSDRICSWTGPYICPTVILLGQAPTCVGACITSINPPLGPVTMTVFGVIITGNGFGTNPTVNAGPGISVQRNSATDSQINANFVIAATATPGNHAVSVRRGTGGSR